MAWIELHQSIWTHRKTLTLAAELNLDETYAAAHMARLWTWALDNAPEGNLTGLPDKVIAFGAGWRGDPQAFVAAMISAGWLDKEGDNLYIHDWDDYAGRLIEKRRQDAERKRRWRGNTKEILKTSAGCHADAPQDGAGNQTKPNLTKPNQKINISSISPGTPAENEGQEPVIQPKKAKKKAIQEDYTPEFEQFWTIYPKKMEKQKAFRLWKTRRKEGLTAEDLVNAAKNYAAFCRKQGTDYKYIKYPTTFLGPDKPFLDWIKAGEENTCAANRPNPTGNTRADPQEHKKSKYPTLRVIDGQEYFG